ncbi:MAG: sugar phosphate isomerase/epimerase [Blautia sp.]|nr:sugar phosphate isomerase/epimerase [Blautia sp.]
MQDQIYFSDLLPEQDMYSIIEKTGMGLESIRFSIAENLDVFSQTLKKEKARLHALCVPALTLHGPFLDLNPMCFDRLVREATLYRFSQAYEAAEILGAGKIVYHSCFVPGVYYLEGWAERMADFWNHFLEDRRGIAVCMENVLDPYAAPFLEVAGAVESPDFGICLDIGHAFCYGRDALPVFTDTLKDRIRHVHLHDNHGQADEHLGLGQGTLPVRDTLRALAAQESPPSWTIECADPEAVLGSFSCLKDTLSEQKISPRS